MPPEWMWALDDELEAWFDEVRFSMRHPSTSVDDDDDEDTPAMTKNIFARGRG